MKAIAKKDAVVKKSMYIQETHDAIVAEMVEKGDVPDKFDFVDNPVVPITSSAGPQPTTITGKAEERTLQLALDNATPAVHATATKVENPVVSSINEITSRPVLEPVENGLKRVAAVFTPLSYQFSNEYNVGFQLFTVVDTTMQLGMSADSITTARTAKETALNTYVAHNVVVDDKTHFLSLFPRTYFQGKPLAIPLLVHSRAIALGLASVHHLVNDATLNNAWMDPLVAMDLGGRRAGLMAMNSRLALGSISRDLPLTREGEIIKLKLACVYSENALRAVAMFNREACTRHVMTSTTLGQADYMLNTILSAYLGTLTTTFVDATETQWEVAYDQQRMSEYMVELDQIFGGWKRSAAVISMDAIRLQPVVFHPLLQTIGPDGQPNGIVSPRLGTTWTFDGLDGRSATYNFIRCDLLGRTSDNADKLNKYMRIVPQIFAFINQQEEIIDLFFGNHIPYRYNAAMDRRFQAEMAIAMEMIRINTNSKEYPDMQSYLSEASKELWHKIFGSRSNEHSIGRLMEHPSIEVRAYAIAKAHIQMCGLTLLLFAAHFANAAELPNKACLTYASTGVPISPGMSQEIKLFHTGQSTDKDNLNVPHQAVTIPFPYFPANVRILSLELTTLSDGVANRWQHPTDSMPSFNKALLKSMVDDCVIDVSLNHSTIIDGVAMNPTFWHDQMITLNPPTITDHFILLDDGIRPQEMSIATFTISGKRTKTGIGLCQFMRDAPLGMLMANATEALYNGHCGLLETLIEQALSKPMDKMPKWVVLSGRFAPITYSISQNVTGIARTPFVDGRRYIQEQYQAWYTQLFKFYFPRGLLSRGERFAL